LEVEDGDGASRDRWHAAFQAWLRWLQRNE